MKQQNGLDLYIKINPNYDICLFYKRLNYKILQPLYQKNEGNFKEAIECLDLCIKLNPNYGPLYENKG